MLSLFVSRTRRERPTAFMVYIESIPMIYRPTQVQSPHHLFPLCRSRGSGWGDWYTARSWWQLNLFTCMHVATQKISIFLLRLARICKKKSGSDLLPDQDDNSTLYIYACDHSKICVACVWTRWIYIRIDCDNNSVRASTNIRKIRVWNTYARIKMYGPLGCWPSVVMPQLW